MRENIVMSCFALFTSLNLSYFKIDRGISMGISEEKNYAGASYKWDLLLCYIKLSKIKKY